MFAGIVAGFLLAFPLAGAVSAAKADLLAAGDARSLQAGLEAVDKGYLLKAQKAARKIKDPVARKILIWARLAKPDPKADFNEISEFMAENPDWPSRRSLQSRAEEAMTSKTPDDVVLAWFAGQKPVSGYGKARLGEALLATGHPLEGRAAIRDAWINGNFTKRREQSFYRRHRRLFSAVDHRRRLDRLQWEGRYWPARRMLWKVSPDYRALGVARLFLRHRQGNVDKAIAKVSNELKSDPGLIYERLRWRRRKGKYEGAREILNQPPDDLIRPERWWRERAFVARRTLRDGHISEAYRLVRDHGLKDVHGAAYAEAEWLAGWIALRFLEEPAAAKKHFVKMFNVVKYPVSRARSAYWAARATEALGDSAGADTWHRLAALHPTTYYGQLSITRLDPGGSLNLPPTLEPGEEESKAFGKHELVRAVRVLGENGGEDWLRPFILALDELAETHGWRQLTAKLAEANGRRDLSVLVAKRAGRDSWKYSEAAFPALTPPPMHKRAGTPAPEKPLVLAVVRQESAFQVKAKSHANAQGLMQLLPRTALKVAKRLRLPFSRRRLVTDGDYNLTLGQAYLAELLEAFEGSYVLALAAYNAGPARVKKWLRRNGDLRNANVDSIDWVERIPFGETRNYVQRVLENLQVYRTRLAETDVTLRIKDDLHQ